MLEVTEIEVDKLKPWEKNPRLNDQAVDAVAKSIRAFGFNVPILCDQDMTIVAGHTRWKAAKTVGMRTVPVIVLHLTDSQRCAFSIADNKTAEIADWDIPKLQELVDELRSEDLDLGELGFSDEELRQLLADDDKDENELPEVASNPETEEGDIWVLGSHRLLCGDSRDRELVEVVIEGQKVEHVYAGPPYFNQRSYSCWDNYTNYLSDMKKIMENCHAVMKNGAVLVWNIGNGSATHHDHTSHHSRLLEESGLCYLDTIAWVKSGANFSIPRNCHIRRNRRYYPAFQWEALLIFQKPGEMPCMTREGADYMAACQINVWEIPAVTDQMRLCGHPAVCPVEVPYRCLQAYTESDATVFEPFGGSGTTLIAAEKSGRRACVVERDPVYCDIIAKRWESLTSRKAQRTSGFAHRQVHGAHSSGDRHGTTAE